MIQEPAKFVYQDAVTALRAYTYENYPEAGSSFATFSELEQRLDFNRTSLQRAVNLLKEEGTLVAKARQGITLHPWAPQGVRYALALPLSPSDPRWSLLMKTVSQQVSVLEKVMGIEIPVYHDVRLGTPSALALESEMLRYRVAGVFGVQLSEEVFSMPGFQTPLIPRFVLFPDLPHNRFPVPSATNDGNTFWPKALNYIQSRGHSRVALIGLAETFDSMRACLRHRQFEIPAKWIQTIDRDYPQTARNLIALLMDAPADRHPSALIVKDDNLLESVIAGVLDNGLTPGKDLDIITHCNWPLVESTSQPVFRIGADIRELMRLTLEYLQCKRRRKSTDHISFHRELLTEAEYHQHDSSEELTSKR